jgi:phospholipid transport system transporter-binding protein
MNKPGITSRGEGRYALTGELTFGTVPELWRSSTDTFSNDTAVRLDLAGISRVDSAGIAMLIELTRLVRNRGGKISLEHAPPQLLAIATVSGLDEVLPFVHASGDFPGN